MSEKNTLSLFRCAITMGVMFAFSLALSVSAQAETPTAHDPVARSSGQAAGAGTTSDQELANQANNPNAPLMQFQLRDVVAPHLPGTNDGAGNLLQILGVVPIPPSRLLPFAQLIKLTLPIVSLPRPVGETGVSDFNFFDVAVFKESWGSWGVGPTLVFPTASQNALGSGMYQAGPAAAIMYTGVENLIVGAVFQNPISYAGDRASVNAMTVTPTLTYTWPSGWYAGLSDFDLTFNWKASGSGVATIPIGLQAGKVIKIGGKPFSLSAEAGYNVIRPDTISEWLIGVEFTAIFSE